MSVQILRMLFPSLNEGKNCKSLLGIHDANEKILEKLMHKRLHTLLNNNNIIYNLQFGFRQHYSTSHALINITENIRKALDEGNIGCGVFDALKIAFDTVDHQILLPKLNHYGIHGVLNDWFKSNLSNHNRYVSINGYDSGLTAVNCGVPKVLF